MQIRDVPDDVREVLVREAERRDQSLQLFLMDVLRREADSARNLQWLSGWTPLVEKYDGPTVAEIVREGRAERDRTIASALEHRSSDSRRPVDD
jgi:antitoxin FitA